MVLRQNEFAHQDKINKLSLKCEDPYKVVPIAHPNAYILKDMEEEKFKNTFNTEHLNNIYA